MTGNNTFIVARAPLRIPLGGGGTDLPSYYRRFGSHFVSMAIDKYIYAAVKWRQDVSYRFSYSKQEEAACIDEIRHPIFREAIRLVCPDRGVEAFTAADILSCTGMGTSGAFTIALLSALHALKGDQITKQEIAEEACRIEIDILGEPVGKQDQYISAFGGVTAFSIDNTGKVSVENLGLSAGVKEDIQNKMRIYYTGERRTASQVLKDQNEASEKGDDAVLERLSRIKSIGYAIRSVLETGRIDEVGVLMHRHWETKKGLSSKISKGAFDRIYEKALSAGAIGGKIMGAGGGGYFLFYCPAGTAERVHAAVTECGLTGPVRFSIDSEGLKTAGI